MPFPDAGALDSLVESHSLPRLARVRYEPPEPRLEDVRGETRAALEELAGDLPADAEVVIGLGSRGIARIDTIARAVVEWCQDRGLSPRIVPAMGSHGGGTAAGQRAVLAELGIDEASVGCPVDASMATTALGTASVDGHRVEVPFATAAQGADAVIPINRIAPHTSFAGRVESGVCKMLAVGFGKQESARRVHRYGRSVGFVPTVAAMLSVIREHVPVPGGVGIMENPAGDLSDVAPIAGDSLIDAEAPVLERAREQVKVLPFDAIDLLVVDEIGKDVAGTGMDPNVIGRGKDDPTGRTPHVERIYARSLTTASQGNANGVGFADVIHRDLAEAIDFQATYANVLTSGYPGKAALPMVLPTDRIAVDALIESLGAVAPEDLGIVWIRNTADVSPMFVSTPLVERTDARHLSAEETLEVAFDGGTMELTRED